MRILTHKATRIGFTLIELLVVMGLIIVLATMVVVIVPSMNANNAVIKAADQGSTWLVTARNRALRDRAARGVRLIPDVNNVTLVRQMEFVEQPDPFRPVDVNGSPVPLVIQANVNMGVPQPVNTAIIGNPSNAANRFDDPTVDATHPNGRAIQIGDILEVNSGGYRRVYVITAHTYDSNTASPTYRLHSITVSTAFVEVSQGQNLATTEYRIIRRWRPLVGETPLELPKGMVVDLNLSDVSQIGTAFDPDTGAKTARIITFSSGGQVAETNGGKIILYVRSDDDAGEPVLITIYARTGAIALHPPGPPNDLYSFTRDGKGSGL